MTDAIPPLRPVMTCEAFPEQYDVFAGDDKVGYLRLRYGCFSAEYMGEEVYYTEEPDGEGYFHDHERARFLAEALKAIDAARQAAAHV